MMVAELQFGILRERLLQGCNVVRCSVPEVLKTGSMFM
jgi:hypothetical protein